MIFGEFLITACMYFIVCHTGYKCSIVLQYKLTQVVDVYEFLLPAYNVNQTERYCSEGEREINLENVLTLRGRQECSEKEREINLLCFAIYHSQCGRRSLGRVRESD